MTFSVDSEVGQLRQAIASPPGTGAVPSDPRQHRRAALRRRLVGEEGQGGARRFRRGAAGQRRPGSLLRSSCSPRRWRSQPGRDFVLDRLCTPELLGPSLVEPVRRLFEDLDGKTLAELPHRRGAQSRPAPDAAPSSLKWEMLRADDFLLAPLPNHLFQRDNSCWIYGGVTINPMAKPARQRESLHTPRHLPLPPHFLPTPSS